VGEVWKGENVALRTDFCNYCSKPGAAVTISPLLRTIARCFVRKSQVMPCENARHGTDASPIA
jgi:hypothetical protein